MIIFTMPFNASSKPVWAKNAVFKKYELLPPEPVLNEKEDI